MSDYHPFIKLFDRIAKLNIRPASKAILWALARHGDWHDGTHCFASVGRLHRETGYSERHIQYALRWLQCSPADAAVGLCSGGARCPHYGLLVCTAIVAGQSRMYTIDFSEQAGQAMLPEIDFAEGVKIGPGRVDSVDNGTRKVLP